MHVSESSVILFGGDVFSPLDVRILSYSTTASWPSFITVLITVRSLCSIVFGRVPVSILIPYCFLSQKFITLYMICLAC
jgi:hypothetical protein